MLICAMQAATAILVQTAFTIQVSQEPSLRQIIKGYATIQISVRLDDMFAKNFPQSAFDNAAAMNAKGHLKFTEDHNTTSAIFARYWKTIQRTFACSK